MVQTSILDVPRLRSRKGWRDARTLWKKKKGPSSRTRRWVIPSDLSTPLQRERQLCRLFPKGKNHFSTSAAAATRRDSNMADCCFIYDQLCPAFQEYFFAFLPSFLLLFFFLLDSRRKDSFSICRSPCLYREIAELAPGEYFSFCWKSGVESKQYPEYRYVFFFLPSFCVFPLTLQQLLYFHVDF